MTNKEASEKFGVLKKTISPWMKNKDKLFEGLEQSSSDAKKMIFYTQWKSTKWWGAIIHRVILRGD